MSKIIGFVLDNYHTELLEFLFEILIEFNFEFIVYINNDNYNYIDILKDNYKFIQKDFNNIERDYLNNICVKYLVLSQTEFFLNYFYPNYTNVMFLIHNQSQLKLIENKKHICYFSVSKSVELGNKYVIPIINKNNNFINSNYINFNQKKSCLVDVIKIGWVVDFKQFDCILETNQIKLHIFTKEKTVHLEKIIKKYKNYVVVYFEKSTKFIYNYINKNQIKYIFYNPDTVDLWSGSIAFALNNNLILLTNELVINFYKIPQTNCISIKKINLIKNKQIDYNCKELIKYKKNIFNINKIKILNLIKFK